MDIRERVTQEVEYLRTSSQVKVVSVGSTARLLSEFLVLPRRSYMQFECINFLVSNEEDARYCFEQADEVADYVLVDVEAKQEVDLMAVAARHLRRAAVVAYKPNDASVEAADLLVRQHFHERISGRSVLILGAGNISSKLALRLAERNARVIMHSRNYEKTGFIAQGLNSILPRHAHYRIEAAERLEYAAGSFECLVSFVAAELIANSETATLIQPGGMAVDGGINNFSPEFISQCQRLGVSCSRLDVRLGFVYSLLALYRDVNNFSTHIRGERTFENIRLVAGGIIGKRGDVIVDKISDPGQVIGIANGIGGVLPEERYTEADRRSMDEVRNKLILRK